MERSHHHDPVRDSARCMGRGDWQKQAWHELAVQEEVREINLSPAHWYFLQESSIAWTNPKPDSKGTQ